MLNIIQPDIWLRRKTRPRAAAIEPVEMPPCDHLSMAIKAIALIMMPLSTATAERTVVTARVSRITAARNFSRPSRM